MILRVPQKSCCLLISYATISFQKVAFRVLGYRFPGRYTERLWVVSLRPESSLPVLAAGKVLRYKPPADKTRQLPHKSRCLRRERDPEIRTATDRPALSGTLARSGEFANTCHSNAACWEDTEVGRETKDMGIVTDLLRRIL